MDSATARQVRAANPDRSTWVSANAGSGKTRVLTDRVARLLLNKVLPQHILCLTYTKAAASEMQNRLFRRLGEWAMLEEAQLADQLRELGLGQNPTQDELREARRLFARAIETPGGLKIQTIHSFCAAILRRFPLEAGVTPQFVEMDDRTSARLREQVVEDIAESDAASVLHELAGWMSGETLIDLTGEILRHRGQFAEHKTESDVWAAVGLTPGFDEGELLSRVFLGGEGALFDRILPVLRASGGNDLKAADRLATVSTAAPTLDDLQTLEGVLLTGSGAKVPHSAKIGSIPKKAVQPTLGDDLDKLNDLMARVETARPLRTALVTARKTMALNGFAGVFLDRYEAAKRDNGWLDFDDLIERARDLLAAPGVSEWILYRLDGGIDHILVDEAQDTSPAQWDVIELLAREFLAGQGARSDIARSVFVVGDKKQSIYSFQGADPGGFDRMKAHFADQLADTGAELQDIELLHSFRSAPGVLQVVDAVFAGDRSAGLGQVANHRAFHQAMPGRVDLWPAIEKADTQDAPHWADPVDLPHPEDPGVQLAQRIATEITRMVSDGEALWERGADGAPAARPVTPGDFLILVQRRNDLFHQIIAACKAAGLPIAGADRLKIGGELAVKDLTALLSFLATPEDDLSLACALRSPLFGWSEDDLFRLSVGRGDRTLWMSLRNQGETETKSVLDDLRSVADFMRPYELIERILTLFSGRRNLIARLGEEAEDGIDAMLAQALSYERLEVPSLTGFLTWLATDEVEIKRQVDSAGGRIRVMTVHGAKGLESPIVILPDTAKRNITIRDEIVGSGDVAFWKPSADQQSQDVRVAVEQARAQQADERQRLLYVAMTRAEQWLITCAAGDLGKDESWYNQVQAGLAAAGAAAQDFGFGRGMRFQTGDWPDPISGVAPTISAAAAPLPDWTSRPAPAAEKRLKTVPPTSLGGAKALPGEGQDEATALARGEGIHLLLEHLPNIPADHWRATAKTLLNAAPGWEEMLAEVQAVLTNPALTPVFAKTAMAEVDISASLGELDGQRLYGKIDRLLVDQGRILAVDFKTNTVVPDRAEDVPDGLLRQMGAYAAALGQVFPGQEIETTILWTKTASLMPLRSQLVAQALRDTSTS